MDNPFDHMLDYIRGLLPSQTFSYDLRSPSAQPTSPQSSPVPSASPQPSANPQASTAQDLIKQNVASLYGADNPVLQNIPSLLQAGQQLPSKADPYLPLVMALRETQGGRDLQDPNKAKNLGDNNIFNITGEQQGNTKRFVNYPDVNTAIFGGANGPDQSRGFVGLVNSPQYQDYAQTGDLAKFLAHYSPPTDSNGALPEQVQNYNWIRSHITKQ